MKNSSAGLFTWKAFYLRANFFVSINNRSGSKGVAGWRAAGPGETLVVD